MSTFPTSYQSPAHLPFNQTALNGRFCLAPPKPAPSEAGLYLLASGGRLLRPPRQPGLLCAGLPAELEVESEIYFGQWDDQPCRLVTLAEDSDPPEGWLLQNLTAPEPQLTIEELSLAGIAMQVAHWDGNSQFCSRCGEPMLWLPLQWGKQCLGCKATHFSHIHPCIIVLIWRPGEILLTRKSNWPPNRYSLVAGFLDLGECLEEAVVREAAEETRVQVGEIRYVGSQNWPFPSQLMAGFTAEYRSGELQVDEDELEDARWFALDRLPNLPPRRSIARYLIDEHLRRQGVAPD